MMTAKDMEFIPSPNNYLAPMIQLLNAVGTRYASEISQIIGRKFKPAQLLSDGDYTIRADFSSRKRKGAMFGDKVSVTLTYNVGLDLYDLKVQTFDGKTFEDNTVSEFSGVYVDQVADPSIMLHELKRF